MATTQNKTVLLGLIALLIAAAGAVSAFAAMRSERIGPNLCETTGGARIADIPEFPGERIDRRLLDDIHLLERRYKIFVTDGYSNDPVHASNGEHPLGLALDIVPDRSRGGTWREISALAAWAEPRQNRPIAPFRWVGYDGDSGHGRGHHLHLSWNHSETRQGRLPATVHTLRCPGGASVPPTGGASGTSSGGAGGAVEPGDDHSAIGGKPAGSGGGGAAGVPSGGVRPGSGGASTTGGVGAGRVAPGEPVAETGGVGGVGAR